MNARFAAVIGLGVGKTGHHACALDPDGNRLFDKPLPQDEAQRTEALLADGAVAELRIDGRGNAAVVDVRAP